MGAVASELESIDGVLEFEPNLEGDFVELRYDADVVTIDEIEERLDGIGYPPKSVRDVEDKS